MYKYLLKTYHNKKHNTQLAQTHSMNAFSMYVALMQVASHIFVMQFFKTCLYAD